MHKRFKEYLRPALATLGLILFFAILYKLYIPRMNAFGCFDDCFNYSAGYFLINGSRIFSDFFFNHMPGMAYISYVIQLFTRPESIPEMLLVHRQFILGASLLMGALLTARFGYKMLIVIFVYELGKFYLFGDRFLAESLVSYLIVYMIGVCLEISKTKKADLIFMPLACYSILYLREPFVPPALLFLGLYFVLTGRKKIKQALISLALFIAITFTTLLHFDIAEFYFNVVTVNKVVAAPDLENNGLILNGILSIIYPIYILFGPVEYTFFRTVLMLISIIFLISLGLYALRLKHYIQSIFIILALSLINLRPLKETWTYYEAFHVSPWYAAILFVTVYLAWKIYHKYKKTGRILLLAILLIGIYMITNKQYFAYSNITTNDEYFTHFSHTMDTGTTIRNLSNPTDTIFVDQYYDDLIIWESKLDSAYKYIWYTSYMPHFEKYTTKRLSMFERNPPDFYYGKCLDHFRSDSDKAGPIIFNNYVQINPVSDLRCILVRKSKVKELTNEKKAKLEGTKYSLPESMK